jgi:hypothetical protein
MAQHLYPLLIDPMQVSLRLHGELRDGRDRRAEARASLRMLDTHVNCALLRQLCKLML